MTASLPSEVEALCGRMEAGYPFNYSDATPLKTALRNNLGLILLKDGYVLDKWAFRDVPDFEQFQAMQPKYERKLQNYQRREPPVLPNGERLQLKPYPLSDENVADHE